MRQRQTPENGTGALWSADALLFETKYGRLARTRASTPGNIPYLPVLAEDHLPFHFPVSYLVGALTRCVRQFRI